jgi:hypothetical protein
MAPQGVGFCLEFLELLRILNSAPVQLAFRLVDLSPLILDLSLALAHSPCSGSTRLFRPTGAFARLSQHGILSEFGVDGGQPVSALVDRQVGLLKPEQGRGSTHGEIIDAMDAEGQAEPMVR